MTIERLSASGVKKFAACPKRYQLRYVDKHPVPEDDDNKYILLGSDVHDAIEQTLKEHEDLRNEEQLLRQFISNDADRYPDGMNEQAQTCFETAAKYISGYVGTDVQAIEEKWTMEYNDIDVVGYCDLVEGGKIIDWKTGKSEGKEIDEKIQAAFYIKLYEEQYGELPEMVDFAYIDEGTRSTHKRVKESGEVMWNKAKNEYWEFTEDIIRQILYSDSQNEWEADPERDKCHWCEYKLFCSDSPVGAENVERRHIDPGR